MASRGSIHGAVNIADVQRISGKKTAHCAAALVLGVDFCPESPRFVCGMCRHIVPPIVRVLGAEGGVEAAIFSFALREPIPADDRK